MANRPKLLGRHFVVGFCAIAIFLAGKIQPVAALDVTQASAEAVPPQKPVTNKRTANANALAPASVESKPAPRRVREPKVSGSAVSGPTASTKGPYFVDFRARTAASYGHAFVWFGKTSERQVEVAGLHPAGDVLPYVLGHLMWVPSETGASYGDLDPDYLTASYRVYLNEPDAKRVFAYIKHLQATSPLWNAETSNCTDFIGKIARFMGMKAPFHLQKPENYVNSLREMNGGRQIVQLAPEEELSAIQ